MIKKFNEMKVAPLKVEVLVEDRETGVPSSFIDTIDEYGYVEVMSRKMGFLTKLHNLLGDKYDTAETRYVGFEWLEK